MAQDLIDRLIDLCNGGRFREAYDLYIENRVDDVNIRGGIESALKTIPTKLTTVPPEYCTEAEIVCKTGMHGGNYTSLIESLTSPSCSYSTMTLAGRSLATSSLFTSESTSGTSLSTLTVKDTATVLKSWSS